MIPPGSYELEALNTIVSFTTGLSGEYVKDATISHACSVKRYSIPYSIRIK
nr:hypothetical protein GZ17C7_33 [uncultured archaeon GZfos17C7]